MVCFMGIGPYFFENEDGKAITVTGECYRIMINNLLWPALVNIDMKTLWFQQDGDLCHAAKETVNLLRSKFQGRIISRNCEVNWPPRSCNLTHLDYFLWGYMKSTVYANNPKTTDDLKDEIPRVILEIEPKLCTQVIDNFNKRMASCQKSLGGHLADIVFHV